MKRLFCLLSALALLLQPVQLSSMARANIMANNLFFIKSPPSLFALPASFLRILYPFAYEYTKANL